MQDFFVGLDLGQTSDPTAVAVLERVVVEQDQWNRPVEPSYAVRHLNRYQLGTPYTQIVPDVVKLCNTPPLKDNCQLAVDQTGVGRPLVEMLRATPDVPRVVPITIISGHTVKVTEDFDFHVPKKDLVACLQLLLQGRRLKVAAGLPLAELLVKELTNFRVKITAAMNETFGAWRDGQHDDLVLAVALACWLAEREPQLGDGAYSVDRRPGVADEGERQGVFLA